MEWCLSSAIFRLYGSWNVDVKRTKRAFFLERGLEEFVVGNSLKLGESLVLQYVGIAKFFVQIYGLNHCERSKASEISLMDSENEEEDVIIIDSDSDPEAQDSEISLMDSENEEEDVIIIDSDSDPEAQDSEISLDSESKCG
ncbi:hypothetical protein ACLB2K_076819 [Fragaria x ananassa]